VATSDLRLIRRIVRDNTYRGSDVMKTIEQWDSVVKGTEKYIFPFQENADVMFNSSLVYELGALKKHAFPLIEKIDDKSELSTEKKRLLNFLGYFRSIDDESIIPNTSILREFIGGSCFS
jgi:uridine kinase